MALAVLRFNFASPGGDPRRQGALLSAALELAQWGDAHGVAAVSVDEHHVTGHGWSCNPIMVAGMFLARTATMFASVDCALGPLWCERLGVTTLRAEQASARGGRLEVCVHGDRVALRGRAVTVMRGELELGEQGAAL